ncbi:multidrug resistance-associated ABC transporter [Phanerochaete sordida]|uniref:Multidrug resistance-associated ABC transporter n=1 Tax=Phanerochaete sordida TaxID=48140 RepID=A0A9P3GQ43_9APHY|nr:multidrug resistance-associated ABC transporter [Phanerochaete sordida]
MCATDARVQLSAEALAVVRTVKMLGWTPRVRATLQGARARELRWVWRRLVLGFVSFNANQLVPVLCMVATYSTYTLAMHRSLTAAVVFSSLTVFGNIRVLLDRASSLLGPATAAYTSLGRLQEFLEKSERLPDAPDDGRGDVVGFGGVVFAWDPPAPTSPASASPPVAPPAAPPTPTLAASATIPAAPPAEQAEQAPPAPPQRGYTLRAARAVRFARGALNVVCGPTGAGKTSLLLALLGEMPVLPYPGRQEGEEGRQEGEEGWVSLPRAGGVAYAAQETWVLSATVRENIVFGAEYDEARYRAVIRACALERDLQMFEEGDGTQVGERGVTLSGGQKARITLARAVYSSAETLLLDDVLAALDVQTARWVVDACFMGELMKGRTVILVTHNVALTAPLAALVVSVDASGAVTCQDGASFARAAPGPAPEGATHRAHRSATLDAWDAGAPPEPNDKARASSGEDRTRAAPEEVALGRVNRAAYGMYLRATGGALHWAGYIGAETAAQACSVLQTWWLGWWARQYAGGARVDAPYYIAVYAAVVGATLVFFLTQSLADSLGRLRASRAIHRQLVDSVLGATFRWLDTTPTSRILTRFTQDIQAVDGAVPQAINILTNTFLGMALKFAAVFAYAPILLLPSLLVVGLGACLGSVYIRAQLAVKRELAARKAPVLAVLGGAVHGLVSIRAYSAQGLFRRMLLQRVDEYTRVSRTFWSLNQWIAVRLDTLSALFAATVAWYLVYVSSIGPSGVGFVLAMAVSFTDLVLRLVNWYNQLEVNANSLERLDQYIHIEQEPTDGEEPPAYWPASGELHVERLTASYAPDGPKVLRDISFDVQSGERVGIVGRTGAGKSTLTLALLRCIHVEGLVAFDGIPIHTIPLDKLRQSITIIPQVPELLSGTLRYNLDPSDELDDKTLYDALRSAGMFSLQEASDINRVTLDTKIIGSGSNFSVGQRQIIALARAIVRGSRLLILDEATSAIDHRTDAVIQKSLRDEMKGVSVITVAHRLQTVMDYDKIMVLDAGRLVEFDTPRALLEKEGGMFRALVESSHSRDALYAAAYGHSHGSTA